jgi:hypothetical protein
MEATITMSAADITILTFSLSAMVLLLSTRRIPFSIGLQIFLISASFFPPHSAPWNQDRDELGQVKILERILEDKKTYQIFLIDDFDSQRPWKIFRGDAFLNNTAFISKIPAGPAWEREKKVLSPWLSQGKEYSFMIHSFIEIPGKEKVEIRPQEPITFPDGVPVRLFFWAYAENVSMSAKLILKQEKSKDLMIDIGDFGFEGWRRIEIPIRIPARNVRLIQSLQIPFQLKGIRISSRPHQKKGPFFIYIDQMSVLLDTSQAKYPGSEIKDNWGD